VLIASTSTEFVHVPVTVPAGVDTGETPVQVAVVSHRANPDDDEWHPAEWDDAEVRIMIGPATDNGLSNSADLVFAGMPAATVVGVEVWDSAGTPVRLWYGPLASPRTVLAGDELQILAGELDFALS